MTWDHLTPRQQSLQVIRAMRDLSLADGSLDPEERQLMHFVGGEHGLSAAEVDAELSADRPTEAVPLTERERMSVLYYLTFLLPSNGEVKESEKAAIYKAGFRLGFREGMVREFIAVADAHRDGRMPPGELLGRIRKYLN